MLERKGIYVWVLQLMSMLIFNTFLIFSNFLTMNFIILFKNLTPSCISKIY